MINTTSKGPYPGSKIQVALGTNIADSQFEEYLYKLKKVVVHQHYSGWNNHSDQSTSTFARTFHDVALLELNRDIVFGDNVEALELAPAGFNP